MPKWTHLLTHTRAHLCKLVAKSFVKSISIGVKQTSRQEGKETETWHSGASVGQQSWPKISASTTTFLARFTTLQKVLSTIF